MMEVIIFEKEAYYGMLREVQVMMQQAIVEVQKNAKAGKQEDEWLTTPEAMKILSIKSKNKLIKLRREGHLKFTMVGRTYRYSKKSINNYLIKNSF